MKKTVFKTVITLIAAAVIALTVIFSGCFLFGTTDTKKWVLNTIKTNYYYYDEMDKDGLEDLTIEEIVSRLDIYSEYYTPEELQALIKDNSGEKAGIGFSYTFLKAGDSSLYPDGGCLLALVVGNSPAEASGLRTGYLLTGGSYNGRTASFDTEDALGNFVDPIPANVPFTLTAYTGKEVKDFTVSKKEYNASYMFMATNSSAWTPAFTGDGKVEGLTEVADRKIEYLPEGTAYISMSQFFGTAADEFGYLIRQFNADHCTSLILDLRDNGGGYVDVMQDMAGYFTSSLGDETYVAMTARYRSGKVETYNCKSYETGSWLVPKDTTVYVLANSGTASASEALIGVLVSYGFLKYENIFLSDFSSEFLTWADGVYGTKRSYGKGIMQTTFTNYFTGEALKLTTAQIYWPNGNCIHGVGVTENDGCRTVQADWLVTSDDSELQRIVEIIKG